MLIFVFKDWRKYFFIKDRCKNEVEDHGRESLNAGEGVDLQSCQLDELLLPRESSIESLCLIK